MKVMADTKRFRRTAKNKCRREVAGMKDTAVETVVLLAQKVRKDWHSSRALGTSRNAEIKATNLM